MEISRISGADSVPSGYSVERPRTEESARPEPEPQKRESTPPPPSETGSRIDVTA